jgi:hypothetical protein
LNRHIINKIAMVAYATNKAYCESIGDDSQPDWVDAQGWQKNSVIAGVEFHLANPEATPAASHESWLAEKERDGWKYGPVKDPGKKEHPCFVPYDQLPIEQRVKDYLFKGVVDAIRPLAE